MPVKYFIYGMFAFAFILNASFSLVTDFLILNFGVIEQLAFYLIFTSMVVSLVLYFNVVSIGCLVVSVIFMLYLMIWSFNGNPEYGMSKAFLGIIVPYLSLLFVSSASWSSRSLNGSVMFTCLLILAVALLYKILFGLFQREVRFGLFGSITFGWVMSFGAIASLTIFKEKRSAIAVGFLLVFVLAIFWSGSKGPLIALSLVMLYMVVKEYSVSKIFLVCVVLVGILFALQDFLLESRAINTFIKLYEDPSGYVEGAGQGSVGSRFDFYKLSILLFSQNPMVGVGFGSWGEYNLGGEHYYPHNLLFEVLAEAGLIGLAYLVYIFMRVNSSKWVMLKYLAIVGIVSMMFSGDFSYFRYPLYFLLLSDLLCQKSLTTGRFGAVNNNVSKRYIS